MDQLQEGLWSCLLLVCAGAADAKHSLGVKHPYKANRHGIMYKVAVVVVQDAGWMYDCSGLRSQTAPVEPCEAAHRGRVDGGCFVD